MNFEPVLITEVMLLSIEVNLQTIMCSEFIRDVVWEIRHNAIYLLFQKSDNLLSSATSS